jgi:hypothetical protein
MSDSPVESRRARRARATDNHTGTVHAPTESAEHGHASALSLYCSNGSKVGPWVYGYSILPGGMTVAVVLLSDKDAVVAVDGLATNRDDSIASEKLYKSCNLNDRLCLVFSGQTDHMARIMLAIDPRCKSISTEFPVEDWIKGKWVYGGSYQQAKEAAEAEYARLVEEVSARWKVEREAGSEHEDDVMSAFLLVGHDGGPVVLSMGAERQGEGRVAVVNEYRHPEPGVSAYLVGLEGFPELGNEIAGRSICGDLIDSIRDAAREHGEALRINGNILVRQLSDGFDEHWELESCS